VNKQRKISSRLFHLLNTHRELRESAATVGHRQQHRSTVRKHYHPNQLTLFVCLFFVYELVTYRASVHFARVSINRCRPTGAKSISGYDGRTRRRPAPSSAIGTLRCLCFVCRFVRCLVLGCIFDCFFFFFFFFCIDSGKLSLILPMLDPKKQQHHHHHHHQYVDVVVTFKFEQHQTRCSFFSFLFLFLFMFCRMQPFERLYESWLASMSMFAISERQVREQNKCDAIRCCRSLT
jgi:hypothetical protein